MAIKKKTSKYNDFGVVFSKKPMYETYIFF
jgi:hypothetical protein